MLTAVDIRIEFEQEEDGRWIAEAIEVPGVLAYGPTKEEARLRAEELARQVLQDWASEAAQ